MILKKFGGLNNSKLTYCQTYQWNLQIYKYWEEKEIRKAVIGKFEYYKVTDDNEVKIIAPLCLRNNEAYIIGKGCGQNYYDFVYGENLEEKYVYKLMVYLKNKGINIIHIPLIRSESDLCKILLKPNNIFKIDKKNSCVVNMKFDFDDYDSYFKSLSKSTRQNIRTAYNRLRKDDIDYKVNVEEKKISETRAKELMNFYVRRHSLDLNNCCLKEKIIQKARRFILGKWDNNKVVFNSMINNDNHRLYSIYIEGNLAAYYYGLVYPENKISFKHVAINDDYKKYSPGMILANEIIKLENKRFKVFDFTTGRENYKYKLGCTDESCYEMQIKL